MSTGLANTTQIRSIQQLRALAALVVVAFHVSLHLPHVFFVGNAGVDVFFVVSGFIMWTISAREPTPGAFAVNRIVRIAPLYWIATAIMAIGALAGAFPHLVLTPAHLLASLFFVPAVSPSSGDVWPVLVQGWTLNYEMFFYALFALALFAPRGLRVWLICAALLALALIGVVLKPQGVLAGFYTNGLVLEFGAGVVIARAMEGGWRLKPWLAVSAIALALLILVLTQMFGGWAARWVMFGLPAVLLVFGAVSLERAGASFAWKPGLFLGDASYSIYLFHTLAVSAVAKFIDFSATPLLGALIGMLGAIVLGAGVFLTIERPLIAALAPARRRAFWAWLSRGRRTGQA